MRLKNWALRIHVTWGLTFQLLREVIDPVSFNCLRMLPVVMHMTVGALLSVLQTSSFLRIELTSSAPIGSSTQADTITSLSSHIIVALAVPFLPVFRIPVYINCPCDNVIIVTLHICPFSVNLSLWLIPINTFIRSSH